MCRVFAAFYKSLVIIEHPYGMLLVTKIGSMNATLNCFNPTLKPFNPTLKLLNLTFKIFNLTLKFPNPMLKIVTHDVATIAS